MNYKHEFLTKNLLNKEYTINNLSIKKIANKYDVSQSYIFKKLKEYSIPTKLRGKCYNVWNKGKKYCFRKFDKTQLYDLYINKKMGMRKICRIFKCSENTIKRHLEFNKIPIRKIHERKNELDYKCDECGKLYKSYPSHRRNKHNFCSFDCYKKSDLHKLENHCCWEGGKSFEPYSPKWSSSLKRRIKNRDNNRCSLCWSKKRLHVHHIDYNKKNCDDNNLVTLCNKCHSSTNHSRDFWTSYFKEVHSLYKFN